MRDRRGVFFVPLHAQFERFQAAQRQPAIERGGNCAGRILQKLDGLKHLRIFCQGRALDGVRMAAQIFRHAVDHDIGAELEWLLEIGRGECVIHHHQRSARMREPADGRDVVDEQARICGRLDPHEARALGDGAFQCCEIGNVQLLHRDADRFEDRVQYSIGAAVNVHRNYDFIARAQVRLQHGVFRGQA